MLKNYILKNWKILFKIQWISFSIFIVLTGIYYWDKTAHVYFNRNPEILTIQSLFSSMMTWLFVLFTFVVLIYPLLFGIQVYFVRHEEGSNNKLLFLFVLYLLSMVSVFSLYTINSSHAIRTAFLCL
ncbi:MAG: hypothetical protein ACN6OB_10230 [Chryseobacterium jejuense]|uniref:hypothetical protein n=1 Tax=Chryseobacterium jejuense TaxID=445960 RepID=UPI003D0CF6AA